MHDRLLTTKMDWTTHVMRKSDVHIEGARRRTHPFDETQQTGHSQRVKRKRRRDTMEGNEHNYPINGQRERKWNLKESDVDYNWHHGERGSTHEEMTKRLRNEKLGLWCSVTDDRIGSCTHTSYVSSNY